MKLAVTVVAAMTFSIVATGAEILFDDETFRVATGDWAARASRGIEFDPVPADVNLEQVSSLLAAQIPTPCPYPADAVRDAIRRFGWAQLECEPERVIDRHNFRVFVAPPGEYLSISAHDMQRGHIGTTGLSLADGSLQTGDVEYRESLDRSVYASLSSPEAFVLNQEHFRQQLFESMLDLRFPGLERVAAAYQDGKHALALYELAEYYRRKSEPAELIRKPIDASGTSLDETAERICQHVFPSGNGTIEMEPNIEWNRQPPAASTAEWLWNFNSHQHFAQLLEGYLDTRNEKYAREFVDQMTDFVIQNPAPPYTLTRVGSWRNLEAGNRMMVSWPASFYGFLSSPEFTPQALALMLGSIWSHGDYIQKHPAGLRTPSNWSIVDSSGLVGVAAYWPELRQATQWSVVGFQRLESQMDLQVYPDGAQYELAPGYHFYCLDRFKRAMLIARQTGFKLPDAYANGLERMYEFAMWISKPDRTVPAFSDSHRTNVRPILLEGAELFDRKDFRFVATIGAEGAQPTSTSKALPYAGYFVMRSDWTPDARYLCFDGGPAGSNHQHEDKLSFVLSAFGMNFIIDPGPHLYTPTPWRKWAVSTAAHSTALIDTQGQRRLFDAYELLAPAEPKPVWQSNDQIDYTAASYDGGYGPDAIPVVHTRHIVFQKPRYWIIIDEFSGEGVHDIQTLFHLAPEIETRVGDDRSVHTDNADGPNLAIIPFPGDGLSVSIAKGIEEPHIQGWDLSEGEQRTPAPTIVYQRSGALPVQQAYLLYPSEQGGQPGGLVNFSATPSEFVAEIRTPEGQTDRIVLDRTKGTVRSGSLP